MNVPEQNSPIRGLPSAKMPSRTRKGYKCLTYLRITEINRTTHFSSLVHFVTLKTYPNNDFLNSSSLRFPNHQKSSYFHQQHTQWRPNKIRWTESRDIIISKVLLVWLWQRRFKQETTPHATATCKKAWAMRSAKSERKARTNVLTG